MYRGFTILGLTTGVPEVRLIPVDGNRGQRPSLVTTTADHMSRTVVILIGRIFYRADLVRRLYDQSGLECAPDVGLVLAVYQQLGRRGIEQIEGEFALVIWDDRRRCLWAQRDAWGSWPLYWCVGSGAIAISTSLESLGNIRSGCSVNQSAIAEFLMQPMPADELPSEQTFFTGISRVRPGTILELPLTGPIVRHPYWVWSSRIEPLAITSLAEAADGFTSLLKQAVAERLPGDGRLAAHLSGGMDSSTLVCLARDAMAARGSIDPLVTLSLVYNRRSLVGERAFIDLVLDQGGAVEPQLLEADDIVCFDWFDRELPRHDEPSGILTLMPRHRSLLEAADRLNAVVTLSGEGSDEIVSFQPYYLVDEVRRGRWLTGLAAASRWAVARNVSLWTIIQQYVLGPLWPIWSREGIDPFLHAGYGTWPKLGFFTIPPWVNRGFAQKHALYTMGRSYAKQMFKYPAATSWNLFILAITSGDWLKWTLAAPLGLNLSYPFRDPRLVCFTLGVNRELQSTKLRKPILETAMRGIVPQEILDKRCSPGFDDVYGLGIRRNLPHLIQMLKTSGFGDLGIVDPGQLISVLKLMALGVGDSQATDRVDKALALFAWFDQFQKPSLVESHQSPIATNFAPIPDSVDSS